MCVQLYENCKIVGQLMKRVLKLLAEGIWVLFAGSVIFVVAFVINLIGAIVRRLV